MPGGVERRKLVFATPSGNWWLRVGVRTESEGRRGWEVMAMRPEAPFRD